MKITKLMRATRKARELTVLPRRENEDLPFFKHMSEVGDSQVSGTRRPSLTPSGWRSGLSQLAKAMRREEPIVTVRPSGAGSRSCSA